MYHCIICKANFENGLRIFIQSVCMIKWVYVCPDCAQGKKQTEICHLASLKADLAETDLNQALATV